MSTSDRREQGYNSTLTEQLSSGQIKWLTNIVREGGYFYGDAEDYLARLIAQVGSDRVVIDDAMYEDGPMDNPLQQGVYLRIDAQSPNS